MTTDPTPLQESIARVMHADDVAAGRAADEFEAMSAESIAWYMSNAAAVLPLIAAEVRKAQADALREAAENVDVGSLADAWTHGAITRLSVTNAVAEVLMSLRNRATDIEKED